MNKKGIELKNNSKIEVTDNTGKITIYEREDNDLEKILLSESEFPKLRELKDEDGSISYSGINQIMDFDGLFYYLTLTIRFFSDKTGLIEILPSFPFNPISKKRETIINEKKAIKNIRWKYIEESQKLKEELQLKEELLDSSAIKLNLGDDAVLEYQYKSELKEEDNIDLFISKNEGDNLTVSEVNFFEDIKLTFYAYDSASKSYIDSISKSTLRFYPDNTMTLTKKNLDNSLNVKKLKLKLTPILLKDNSTIEVTDLTTGETKKYESFIKFKIQKALEDEFLIEKNYIKDKSTNMAPILYLSNESNQYVYTDVINTNFKRTITFFSNQTGTFSTTGKPPNDISWKYISDSKKLEDLEAQDVEITIPELESELRDVTNRRKTRDVTNRRKTRDVTNRRKTDNGIILLATTFLFKKLK